MIKTDLQESLEVNFCKEHVDRALSDYIDSQYREGVDLGAQYLREWLDDVAANCMSPQKQERVKFLEEMDLRELVLKVFVTVAYYKIDTLFTTVTAITAGVLKFSDKAEAIQTCAEVYAVLAHTGAFTIYKEDRGDSLKVRSLIELPEVLDRKINNTMFTLPVACIPTTLYENTDSPYRTVKDKLILGKGNFHTGNISLDVLNKLNQIPLALNTQFLCTVEEEPTKEWETPEQEENWKVFKEQSYYVYKLIANQYKNEFYLPNSVDKRGRIYARGYHVTTQGTSFKKSMIDFAKKEVIKVPQEYRRTV